MEYKVLEKKDKKVTIEIIDNQKNKKFRECRLIVNLKYISDCIIF